VTSLYQVRRFSGIVVRTGGLMTSLYQVRRFSDILVSGEKA
jgi:hypothetical protein